MSKCKGCGITIQNKDINALGYSPNMNNRLCTRCFKIKNYNYHENASKNLNNNEIIDSINDKKAFTFFLCDILSLNSKIISLYERINNPKILVITKEDIIPKNANLSSLKKRIKDAYNIPDLLFISIKNGYGKSKILEYLNAYQKTIFAGPTSSGKSSLINYLFNYDLTVSNYKNTTQEFITLNDENHVIIDAPGFTEDYLKDIKISGYLTPKTLLIKDSYELVIDDIILSADKDLNVTLYFPKDIIFKTRKKVVNYSKQIEIMNNCDLIINNIGFIYFKNGATLKVNELKYLDIRRSIVGGNNE